MKSSPPKWQAHDAVDYDRTMGAQCGNLLNEIVTDSSRRRSILTKPQELHRELFASFVPPGFDEYAGTYRGTLGTLLVGRETTSPSQLHNGSYAFCASSDVPERIERLLDETRGFLYDTNSKANDYQNLLGLAYTFCWFGKIHPFLDGNGHVQRAIFAAMATEFGYPLSARFAIHPRPYDRLLATALEIFTRAPEGEEVQELPLAAEYLAFFLDGPFNAPRKHVSGESL